MSDAFIVRSNLSFSWPFTVGVVLGNVTLPRPSTPAAVPHA
ncbi:hypothetical protein [Actinomadura rugatobispora]|uniref:Uncharacterized protein n=1 Tax=Actinomadura rugatobispora TaxID=1994 RepID=A0ABW0ZVS8_9ACTN